MLGHRVAVVGGAIVAAGALALTVARLRHRAAAAPMPAKAQLCVLCPSPEGKDPDIGPFCTKLMAFLALAGVEYDAYSISKHGMRDAPKHKVPYMRWAELGPQPVGDSQLLIEALVSRGYGAQLDARLSPEEVAIGTAFRVMAEESIYWMIIAIRWTSPEFERVTRDVIFASAPAILRPLIGAQVQREVLRTFDGQGVGRLTAAEQLHLLTTQLAAVSAFLATKRFLFGDAPTTYDCSLYGVFSALTQGDWRSPLVDAARGFNNLVTHRDRMRALVVSGR